MRKGIGSSFLGGWFTAVRIPGVLLLKWLANVVFTVGCTVSLGFYLYEHFGHSALTEGLAEGVAMDTVIEFTSAYEGELRMAVIMAMPLAVLFILLHVFLTGGILQVAYMRRRLTWSEFFGACGRRFLPLLGVGVLSILHFALLVAAPYKGLTMLHDFLVKNTTSPGLSFYFTWIQIVILFLLLTWVARVNDYGRILLVIGRTANPFLSFGRAIMFASAKVFRTFFLWLVLMAPPVAMGAAYVYGVQQGDVYFGKGSLESLMIMLIAGQLLIFLRGAAAVARLAGQMRYAEGHLPPGEGYDVIPHPDHEERNNR